MQAFLGQRHGWATQQSAFSTGGAWRLYTAMPGEGHSLVSCTSQGLLACSEDTFCDTDAQCRQLVSLAHPSIVLTIH